MFFGHGSVRPRRVTYQPTADGCGCLPTRGLFSLNAEGTENRRRGVSLSERNLPVHLASPVRRELASPRLPLSVSSALRTAYNRHNHRCHRYGLRPTRIYTDEENCIRVHLCPAKRVSVPSVVLTLWGRRLTTEHTEEL